MRKERFVVPVVALFLLLGAALANLYYLHSELGKFYRLVIDEEVARIRSVVEGTIAAGGDPVEALSVYLEKSKLLKGVTFSLEGREVIVPGSQISKDYYKVTLSVKPFTFNLYIDASYLKELNKHILLASLFLIFFSLLSVSLLLWYMREFYKEKIALELEKKEKERLSTINLVIHSLLHEVKNRLNAFRLLLYRLEKTGDASYIEKLKGEVALLSRYIEETADLRRPLKLNRAPVRIDSLLREVAEKFKDLAEANGVKIELSVEPAELLADRDRLYSLFSDLLKNAIEALSSYRGERIVKITGRSFRDVYRVEVADSAGSLPKDAFKLFSSSKKGGFGLGLFNARRIALAHNGSLSARVEKGWTVFRVELPLR